MKKKIKLLISGLLATLCMSASAADWMYNGSTQITDGNWTLTVSRTVVSGVTNLTITGVRTNGTNPHVDLSKGFTSGSVQITALANNTFLNNQTITSVTQIGRAHV